MNEHMTVVIVGTFESETVSTLTSSLRRRGFAVLALESVSLVGPLLLTKCVLAVVVFEAQISRDWESMRRRMVEMSPRTPIVFVPMQDERTAEQLACETVRVYEE